MKTLAIIKAVFIEFTAFGRMKKCCKLRETVVQIKSCGACEGLEQFMFTRACMERMVLCVVPANR